SARTDCGGRLPLFMKAEVTAPLALRTLSMPSTYLSRPSMRATLFLHATRAFSRAVRPSENYLAWSCRVLRTLLRPKDGEIADARKPEGVLPFTQGAGRVSRPGSRPSL